VYLKTGKAFELIDPKLIVSAVPSGLFSPLLPIFETDTKVDWPSVLFVILTPPLKLLVKLLKTIVPVLLTPNTKLVTLFVAVEFVNEVVFAVTAVRFARAALRLIIFPLMADTVVLAGIPGPVMVELTVIPAVLTDEIWLGAGASALRVTALVVGVALVVALTVHTVPLVIRVEVVALDRELFKVMAVVVKLVMSVLGGMPGPEMAQLVTRPVLVTILYLYPPPLV